MKVLNRPWAWSFLAAALVWLATVWVTKGAASGGLTEAALTFAAFSVLVGIGQMFVITLGPGNIDLSVPATMTLAGTLALKLMNGAEGMVIPGLLVTLGIGIGVGLANYALIKALRIPPIIATLSMSFIIQSIAIWSNRGIRIKPPESLADFTTSSTLAIPNVALVALGVSILAWVPLNRSVYGRQVAAIEQHLAQEQTRFTRLRIGLDLGLDVDQRGRPVEHIAILYRPDRYQYRTKLARVRGPVTRMWSHA